MTDLVSMETALAHVRQDAGVEDDLVAIYLQAAITAASNYCNRQFFATADDMAAAVLAGTAGEDPAVINDATVAAILLILGKLYGIREDVVTGTGKTVQKLPDGSQYLLQPYRVGMGV